MDIEYLTEYEMQGLDMTHSKALVFSLQQLIGELLLKNQILRERLRMYEGMSRASNEIN